MNERYRIERNIRPPRWAVRFLEWFCPPFLYEGIAGDLMEAFDDDVRKRGEKFAKRRFVLNSLKFCRPGIVLRNRFSAGAMNGAMLRSYFRISFRHLAKSRMFAAINVFGLALGMAAALLIYEYVRFEKSFDTFHKNADYIYRVTTVWNKDATPEDRRATTMPWSGPGVKEEFPEVLEYARFAPLHRFSGDNPVVYKNRSMHEQGIYLADPGFLKIFTFPLLKGDPAKALTDPESVVITENIARKYFGDEDPIGKALFIDTHGNLRSNNFTVTGVVQDVPANSHIDFDFLVSFSAIWPSLSDGSTYWHWDYTYCYLLLRPDADVSLLEKKIGDRRVARFGAEMGSWNDRVDFRLQSLQEIHLFSSLRGELQTNGDGRSLYFLVTIGFCIMLSAYINYINLSTVKAVERRTEIGIRKVVGSSRFQLMAQLFVESFILNVMAVVAAIALFRLSVPVIEGIFNIQWPSWQRSFFSADFISIAAAVIGAGVILSALYPAFILTSLKPAAVLKGAGMPSPGERRWSLRQFLTVMQFVFCIAFTVGTYAFYTQLRHMKDHDLGMNIERVIAVRGYGFQPYSVYEQFKARLSSASFVSAVGASSSAPGDEIIELGLRPRVALADQPSAGKELKLVTVDEDYFKLLNVSFAAGRNFDRSIRTDARAAIINEAAAKLLGFEDVTAIVNESLRGLQREDLVVVGVIKNYNQRSLKDQYEPMVFVPNWVHDNDFGWNKRYFFVRFQPAGSLDGLGAQIAAVDKAWKESNPGKPFQYFFLDNHFDHQYKADTAFSALFLFFSGLAIVIACLGLFGLVSYTTLQRTREIGIRKVLGATAHNILTLLSKEFIKLIIVAGVIATPLIGWGLDQWLNRYAFRIGMSVWLFVIPLSGIFIVALLTVLLRSWKAAGANPVDSLRYE